MLVRPYREIVKPILSYPCLLPWLLTPCCIFAGPWRDFHPHLALSLQPSLHSVRVPVDRSDMAGQKHATCGYCGKSFANKHNLSVHERIHTGEKPYKCQLCYKDFITASSLKIHTRTHTGERPYKCEVCGRGFIDSSNLKAHRVVHHNK